MYNICVNTYFYIHTDQNKSKQEKTCLSNTEEQSKKKNCFYIKRCKNEERKCVTFLRSVQ